MTESGLVSWGGVKSAAGGLFSQALARDAFAREWRAFRELALTVAADPPQHIARLLESLTAVTGNRDRAGVGILDHGCGGGITVIFLIALGWSGARGVDIKHGASFERLNGILRENGLVSGPVFQEYDGGDLPFGDKCFDFIFSQQVIEHVSDRQIDLFYAEEGRTLKPGGCVYHQIPHRLTPYDTHTRQWLIHYLPRGLQRPFYRLARQEPDYVHSFLFLRTPGFHFREVRKHIGEPENLTARRLAQTVVEHKHHKGLRNLMSVLFRAPLIGRLIGPVILSLVMLEVTASKPT